MKSKRFAPVHACSRESRLGPGDAPRGRARAARATAAAAVDYTESLVGTKLLQKFAKFANVWRARSRLYQNEILQENMRLTAFFKIYKMCTLCTAQNSTLQQKIGSKISS